jgi:DNA-directed RNA polymerase specialized sigma24 family protein
MSQVTQLLQEVQDGNLQAAERLLPVVYDELRRLAAHRLRREAAGQTLEATALVHEAYVRLVDSDRTTAWDNRGPGQVGQDTHLLGRGATAIKVGTADAAV